MKLTQSIYNEVVNSLPEAMSLKWLSDTYSGTYGSKNFTVKSNDLYSDFKLNRGHLTGTSVFDGVIENNEFGRANQIGTITRKVYLDRSGILDVEHNYLRLENSYHKTGFATDLNNRAMQSYKDSGVDRITVETGLSAGGYVWARQGFELLNYNSEHPEKHALKIAEMVRDAVENKKITDQEYASVVRRLALYKGSYTPDKISKISELADIPIIGEKVLMGSQWRGEQPVNPTSIWKTKHGISAHDANAGALLAQDFYRTISDSLELPKVVSGVYESTGLNDAKKAVNSLDISVSITPMIDGKSTSEIAVNIPIFHHNRRENIQLFTDTEGALVGSNHISLDDRSQQKLAKFLEQNNIEYVKES